MTNYEEEKGFNKTNINWYKPTYGKSLTNPCK